MNVSIYSKKATEKLIADKNFPENTAVISFFDPASKHSGKSYSHIDYSEVCQNVCYCEVEDLDHDYLSAKGHTYDSFFPEADETAKFIFNAYNSGMNIICQCDYGQSRSAGCAAAILEFFYHTGITVFADYKYYPNQVIYHKIYDALEKTKNNG